MSGMRLKGKTAVLLIAEGYYEHEYWFPYYRFLEEGASVITAGLRTGVVQGEGIHGTDGLKATIGHTVNELNAGDTDILFLPGGMYGPMELRDDENVLNYVRACFEKNKLVCAICHAPWILVSAGVLNGRRVSCPRDMSADVKGAGAEYMKEYVTADGNLLTADGYHALPEMFRELFATYYP